MTSMTREWLSKAEADLRVALREFAARPASHDIVCFHCQQAAEKYLKGLLQDSGLMIVKTHDLGKLLVLLFAVDPTLKTLRRVAKSLTRYAVEYRYPGLKADRRKSKAALAAAERIRASVRRRLGLRL